MPPERRSERRTRRRVFRLWVGLTVVFALLLALALPFLRGEPFAYLAGVPVVALDLVLLALALGWLVWFVWRPRHRGEPQQPSARPRG
jgi:hypothetical protein